jgi:hypothetical protein
LGGKLQDALGSLCTLSTPAPHQVPSAGRAVHGDGFFFSCIVKEKLTNCQRITFQLHVMETYKCKFPERFTRGEMMRNRFYSIWKLLIRHEHSFKLKKSSFPSFARFGGPGEKFSFQSSAFNANTVAYFHMRCLMLSGSS